MKRILFIILSLYIGFNSLIYSQTKYVYPTENINYEIVYHWGIIWKHAASATLSSHSNGNIFNAKMVARTVSWADNIYKIRDTLYSTIDKTNFKPLCYVKASHEGKSFSKDIIHYTYNDSQTTAKASLYRKDKPIALNTMYNNGPGYDMLSVFYFLRALDFPNLKSDTVYQTFVFSGSKKEKLSIKYIGVEAIKLRDNSTHKAYHIKFSFTQKGQKKSSDDLDSWISLDSSHIPLMIRGKLPIGEVRCYYKNK